MPALAAALVHPAPRRASASAEGLQAGGGSLKMKFAEPRPHADPEKAARRIVGIVSTCAALVPAGSSL